MSGFSPDPTGRARTSTTNVSVPMRATRRRWRGGRLERVFDARTVDRISYAIIGLAVGVALAACIR